MAQIACQGHWSGLCRATAAAEHFNRLRVVPATCSLLAMCITLSLEDEEKRSTEVDNHTTDHQSEALVRTNVYFSISFQLDFGKKT